MSRHRAPLRWWGSIESQRHGQGPAESSLELLDGVRGAAQLQSVSRDRTTHAHWKLVDLLSLPIAVINLWLA